jgi:lipoprotein-anchoring transpeptidase ErfK/SrfK
MKVLMENDKVRAYEVTSRPGDVNAAIPSTTTRVIHVVQGGTQEYTYADGKKETRVRKTGDVYMGDVGPAYTAKNVGKTVFQVYVVQVK